MLAAVERSGLVEAVHEGCVVVSDLEGRLVASFGDIDRPFYLRSSAKPFQARVAQRCGADLCPEQMAVACASHDGDPVHLAHVSQMLAQVGLGEGDLGCPPARPIGQGAMIRLAGEGLRRLFNNCSGKHAAMLRACVAQGWATTSYLEPHHPLQLEVLEEVTDVGLLADGPVGVDGCGTPVYPTTVRSMARGFARLASDPSYEGVFDSMHRFPTLVSGTGNADAVVATWLHAAAKRGAEGCLGIALRGQGAVAVKSWDGSERAVAVTVLAALEQMGWIPGGSRKNMEYALRRPVFGGGREVGTVRPMFVLR